MKKRLILTFVLLSFSAYGTADGDDYAPAPVKGLPPTQSSHASLLEPLEFARKMVSAGGDLVKVLKAFEAGEYSKRDFELRFDERLNVIRRLALKIRRDPYLSYVDRRIDAKVQSYERASSVPELSELVKELSGLAAQVEECISSLSQRKVISIGNLKYPSFKSVSVNIDRLAKILQESVEAM